MWLILHGSGVRGGEGAVSKSSLLHSRHPECRFDDRYVLAAPLVLEEPHLKLALGRTTPNFVADKIGSINCLAFMCWGSGIMAFAVFGAGTSGGLIAVAIIFGFFSGGYVSLLSPAIIGLSNNFGEIGIRLGMAFLVTSIAALTGTPITGALLVKYGFYAPITWSGVSICAGAVSITMARVLRAREKGTWKV